MSQSQNRSSLAVVFLRRIPRSLKPYRTGDLKRILRIPAEAPEVGDLEVFDDTFELTVSVGRWWHRHFGDFYDETLALRQRNERDAAWAIEWILSVLSERTHLGVQFCEGRLLASGDWYCDEEPRVRLLSKADEYREFSWTGQLVRRTEG
jgi:hypothetical protein